MDPAAFGAVALLLLAVALAACAVPARRALALAPAVVLRADGPGGAPAICYCSPMLRRLLSVALVLAAQAGAARAQEWHESYRDGVKALAQGQPARAVALLEAAAAQRPQPGRNVITYGTNVVERYHPYLRLAEAHLALRDVAAARAALRRSETWAREPAEERRAPGGAGRGARARGSRRP